MTADEADRYQVIVDRAGVGPGRFNYQFARYRAPGEPGPRLELLGDVTTPECTRRQAEELALAWLRLTRPGDVPGDALEFVWAPGDPSGEPTQDAGTVVHYAAVRRPRRRLRLRRR